MIFINHRINTVKQLQNIPIQNGIELDVRYHNDDLVLHHDPFGHHRTNPERFEDVLAAWNHDGPMILNVKTEGIEQLCIDLMAKYHIKNWFFLDLSMPFFAIFAENAANYSIANFGPNNLAVRFSEREPIEYALAFAGKAKWIWIDCFTKLAVDAEMIATIRAAGFKICIVSPELQKHPYSDIASFRRLLDELKIDAVCTKRPDLWGQETTAEVQGQLERNYPELS